MVRSTVPPFLNVASLTPPTGLASLTSTVTGPPEVLLSLLPPVPMMMAATTITATARPSSTRRWLRGMVRWSPRGSGSGVARGRTRPRAGEPDRLRGRGRPPGAGVGQGRAAARGGGPRARRAAHEPPAALHDARDRARGAGRAGRPQAGR